MPMVISDAQIHVWEEDSPRRPWKPGATPPGMRAGGYEAPTIVEEMGRAGVARAVLVPPTLEGGRNDLALDACRRYPGRFGVMAQFLPERGDRDRLRELLREPDVLGLRFNWMRARSLDFLLDGSHDWVLDEVAAADKALMVLAPGANSQLGEVASRFKGVRFILDHCNIPSSARDGEIIPRIDALCELADEANIAVKVSALPCVTTEVSPFPLVLGQARRVIEAFGAARCMWGSDLSRLPCSYEEWIRAFTEAADFLQPDQVAMLMSGTLEHWLKWPVCESSVMNAGAC
jgi:L-fuconolactonase